MYAWGPAEGRALSAVRADCYSFAMQLRISEGESKRATRLLRVYALGAVGVWLLSLWVCRGAVTPRPRSLFAPSVDVVPWATFGVAVFGVAAVGAWRPATDSSDARSRSQADPWPDAPLSPPPPSPRNAP